MRDHYEVLGISKDATSTQVKTAFKQKLLIWHNDKKLFTLPGINVENLAKAETLLIQQAFSTLKDEIKRAVYDRMPRSTLKPTKEEVKRLITIYTYEILYYQERLTTARVKALEKIAETSESDTETVEALEISYEHMNAKLQYKITELQEMLPPKVDKKIKFGAPLPPKQHLNQQSQSSPFFHTQQTHHHTAHKATSSSDAIISIEKKYDGTSLNIVFKNEQVYDDFNVKCDQSALRGKFRVARILNLPNSTVTGFYDACSYCFKLRTQVSTQERQKYTDMLLTWIREQYPDAPSKPSFKGEHRVILRPGLSRVNKQATVVQVSMPGLNSNNVQGTLIQVPNKLVDIAFKVEADCNAAEQQLISLAPQHNNSTPLQFRRVHDPVNMGSQFHLIISHPKMTADEILDLLKQTFCILKTWNSDTLLPDDKAALDRHNNLGAILKIEKGYSSVTVIFKDESVSATFATRWKDFLGVYLFEKLQVRKSSWKTAYEVTITAVDSVLSDNTKLSDAFILLLSWISTQYPDAPKIPGFPQDSKSGRSASRSDIGSKPAATASSSFDQQPTPFATSSKPTFKGEHRVILRPGISRVKNQATVVQVPAPGSNTDNLQGTVVQVPSKLVDIEFKLEADCNAAEQLLISLALRPNNSTPLQFRRVHDPINMGSRFHLIISHPKMIGDEILDLLKQTFCITKTWNSDCLLPDDKAALDKSKKRGAILLIKKDYSSVTVVFEDKSASDAFEILWNTFCDRDCFDKLQVLKSSWKAAFEVTIPISRALSSDDTKLSDALLKLLSWIATEYPDAPKDKLAEAQSKSNYQQARCGF